MRLPSLNSFADSVWVCFISTHLYIIQSTLEGSVISFTERGECFKKCVNVHPCETSACVKQVYIMRLAVTGCLWISKHSVHNLACTILMGLTSSLYNRHGLSLWFLLTTGLCFSVPVSFFLFLTVDVVLELPYRLVYQFIISCGYYLTTEKLKFNIVMPWWHLWSLWNLLCEQPVTQSDHWQIIHVMSCGHAIIRQLGQLLWIHAKCEYLGKSLNRVWQGKRKLWLQSY